MKWVVRSVDKSGTFNANVVECDGENDTKQVNVSAFRRTATFVLLIAETRTKYFAVPISPIMRAPLVSYFVRIQK